MQKRGKNHERGGPQSSAQKRSHTGLLLIGLLVLLWPQAVRAHEVAYYQRELSPASFQLLQKMQEAGQAGEPERGLQLFAEQVSESRRQLPVLCGFVAANLNFQAQRYSEAIRLYLEVLARAPEFDAVYENLGQAQLLTEAYAAAARNLLEAACRRPEKAAQLRYQAAVALLYGQDAVGARDLLRELSESVASPPVAWLKALLQAHWQLRETAAALKIAARLLDLEPEGIENWRLYGQLNLANGDYRRALTAYKVIQAAGQLQPAEYKLLAGIYQQLQLFQAAAAAWELYLGSEKPTRADLETLVALYAQAGEFDSVLKTLDRLQPFIEAVELDFRRGKFLYQAGRYEEAYRLLNRLEQLVEEDGYQYLLAGYCAWNLNRFSAAAAAWGKAAARPAWRRQAQALLDRLKPWLEAAS
ncbi:MAG TPA: hypothetical protein ENN66_05865 [Proteobacteria bacterium]|nr:hypothetical protein [Pseudomonadota bacterium]